MAHTPQVALVQQAMYSYSRDTYRRRARWQEINAKLAMYPVPRGRVENVVPVRERPRP